ncbi:hypothetical protein KIW84_022897 [Lathyrus oleraceus]|uniref:Uncharacterized protein n=1 Tax=Pisum sativum TaxID=3888 RepID=A0A9D5BAJ0_PEA|nr:hypothetical protein KIW84_022897 [Pisum sativum]
MLLSEYDIEYRSQKAVKGSVLVDHLAHQPIEDYHSVQYDFPDEEILYLKMKDCDEPFLEEGPEPGSPRLTFNCTNNMVEYEACIMGLEEAIDLRIKPAHVFAVEEIKDENSWYFDIKCFLQSQIYPPRASLKDKKTLRRLAGNFYLNGDMLYKRNFDMVLLRCMDRHEADLLTTEVHEGSFGTHSNGHAIAKKMLRADSCSSDTVECYFLPMARLHVGNRYDCHEVANKNIKKIIQKMVVTYKDWHEMIPFALHGYRTSIRTSTGETHFSLVYGMEVVLPVEVKIPSLCALMEAKLIEAEWCQTRYDHLNLIEEKRLTAMCHGQLYQQRMKKAFDKKVRPRMFRKGDLVLKKIISFKPDSRGKMDS